MMTKEETMKVIAEGVSPETYCPIVDIIAKQVAYGFELAAEHSFENDEDEIIFDLIMRLFAKGEYMEAVDVLALTFSLIDAGEAFGLVALIASTGRDEVYEMFMHRFVEHSDRCEVKKINILVDENLS